MYSTEMGNGNLAKNGKYVCLAYFSSRSRRRGGYRGGEGHSPLLTDSGKCIAPPPEISNFLFLFSE